MKAKEASVRNGFRLMPDRPPLEGTRIPKVGFVYFNIFL